MNCLSYFLHILRKVHQHDTRHKHDFHTHFVHTDCAINISDDAPRRPLGVPYWKMAQLPLSSPNSPKLYPMQLQWEYAYLRRDAQRLPWIWNFPSISISIYGCSVYRVAPKTKSKPQTFIHIFAKYWQIFNFFFTGTFCGKYVIKWLLNILRRLICVATLLCQI